MKPWALFLLLLPLSVFAGLSNLIGKGPLLDESFQPGLKPSLDQELSLSGFNHAEQDITLVVRMDDAASRDYATQVNLERVLPPGPFRIRIPLGGLKKVNHKFIGPEGIQRLMVSAYPRAGLKLNDWFITKPQSLGKDVHAYDLGTSDSPVFPGFQSLSTDYPGLKGQHLKALRRPGPDALIGDGIQGIERLALAIPNGDWNLTLWTEDPGEWEYFPHPRERRVRVNGQTLDYFLYQPEEWAEKVYLQGRLREALIDGDPWETLGAPRGGQLSAPVKVTDGKLIIELAGDTVWATHLAAVLLEPVAEQGYAKALLEGERATRFRETWRHQEVAPQEPPPRLTLRQLPTGRVLKADTRGKDVERLRAQAGPDGWVSLDVLVHAIADDDQPSIWMRPPKNVDQKKLPMQLRWGVWRWERPSASATRLEARSDALVSGMSKIRLRKGLPRRLNLLVQIPMGTQPGVYRGELGVRSHGEGIKLPIEIEVLDVALPKPDRPIGVYLDHAPNLTWFSGLKTARDQQAACDMRWLHALGLTGIAPPLEVPLGKQAARQFRKDVKAANDAGFVTDLFAYSAVKRLAMRIPPDEIAQLLSLQVQVLQASGMAAPIWAAADEPSNAAHGSGDAHFLRKLHRALDTKPEPRPRIAAQLNAKKDRELLDTLDVALINHGYGVDVSDVQAVQGQGVTPWFYNLPRPRLAAGFYLWRANAQGYLQWHARMPTARPFDPTDGREADRQMLYPMADTCAPRLDLDARLLEIAQGIIDLRWLLWLRDQSNDHPEAKRLLRRIHGQVPDTWERILALPGSAPDLWRTEIMKLAQKLLVH